MEGLASSVEGNHSERKGLSMAHRAVRQRKSGMLLQDR